MVTLTSSLWRKGMDCIMSHFGNVICPLLGMMPKILSSCAYVIIYLLSHIPLD